MQRSEECKITFSVIITVYNAGETLPACIKSVVEQPGPADWECILVDDGSTDCSPKMCDTFAELTPGVVVVHQENGGVAAARNTGLRAAQGEWVLFLDSDDRWQPGMLAELRKTLAEQPGYDWYLARYLELDDTTGKTAPPAELNYTPGAFESEDYATRVARLYDSCHWAVWKYCLRRETLKKYRVRFLPQSPWGEELYFNLVLLLHCKRLYFADFIMTIYRANRAGSLMNTNLPRHFVGLVATMRGFARLRATEGCSEEEYKEILRRLANAFWPEARAAATRDAEVRHACVPGVDRCRALYDYGEQAQGRADWVLFRWLLKIFGAKFGLWAAAQLKRKN